VAGQQEPRAAAAEASRWASPSGRLVVCLSAQALRPPRPAGVACGGGGIRLRHRRCQLYVESHIYLSH
jgi:hypothetical protein